MNFVSSTDIKSSMVKRAAYTDSGDLVLTFNNGSEYLYKAVPVEVYDTLVSSLSVGKFIAAEIKGKYEFVQLPKSQS